MNFLKKLVFNGEVPYFRILKNILKFVPLAGVIIFLRPELYVEI